MENDASGKFRLFRLRMIISEIRHRNHRIHLADDMHPFLHLHHIGILPFQKTGEWNSWHLAKRTEAKLRMAR
jgi:hypothetical protein